MEVGVVVVGVVRHVDAVVVVHVVQVEALDHVDLELVDVVPVDNFVSMNGGQKTLSTILGQN